MVTKTIPKENKCKKAKWLSEKALQIAEKRREAKGKGERSTHLNADGFTEEQAVSQTHRDTKTFLNDQCKK